MSASAQPWIKFYPADWRADPALRVCSVGARGAWTEMLCLMHEAEPRGSLLIAGKKPSEAQLAVLIGVSRKILAALISELEQANVFSRDEDGTIYSRRMRRDVAKAERDKANGKAGGNPNLKRGVNPQDNGGDKAQNPEPRTQTTSLRSDVRPKRVRTRHDYPPDFLEFWDAYPTDANMGKREAFAEWQKLDEVERRQAIASCPAFVRHCKADPTYRPIHAGRYLAKRRFEGHAEAQTGARQAAQTVDFGGGIIWPEPTVIAAVERWRADPTTWPRDRIGPPPGLPGCRVPEHLISEAA